MLLSVVELEVAIAEKENLWMMSVLGVESMKQWVGLGGDKRVVELESREQMEMMPGKKVACSPTCPGLDSRTMSASTIDRHQGVDRNRLRFLSPKWVSTPNETPPQKKKTDQISGVIYQLERWIGCAPIEVNQVVVFVEQNGPVGRHHPVSKVMHVLFRSAGDLHLVGSSQ